MEDLRIEYVGLSEIRPYENNARKHATEDVGAIVKSIEQFGFLDPIGIWRGVIVEGHGRWLAAKKLGLKTVPIMRLDQLTDEQRRAYALAHNKTAELSAWDFEALDAEINDLTDFDMEDFGFEFRDAFIEHEQNREATQERVERILGLDKGAFVGSGKYDIPVLAPVKELPPIREWIGFNYVLSDIDPAGKAVHFFIDDYQFERIWNDPDRYVEKLRQYVCVATPDFSPYADMPLACQLFNHYRKHWVGAYLQANGITVVPTIRASRDERSLEWYLDGEPVGGICLISAMWTKDKDSLDYFRREYSGMMEKLKPEKVFVYGKRLELPGNTEFVPAFTAKRFGKEDD